MKKLTLAVALVTLTVLAMPATASAHKLRGGFAVKQARAVAQEFAFTHFFFTEQDTVDPAGDYTSKQFCTRASPHKIFCVVGWIYDDVASDEFAICVGEAQSKLKRRSNKVVTTLRESDVECELGAPTSSARNQLQAALGR